MPIDSVNSISVRDANVVRCNANKNTQLLVDLINNLVTLSTSTCR